MSIINIYILVDTEKIKGLKPGKIEDAKDYIAMYDDQHHGLYTNIDKSDLITSVSNGDLLIWTLLPSDKNLSEEDYPQFNSIEDSTNRKLDGKGPLFTDNKALIFDRNRKASAAISDSISDSMSGKNSYIISFKISCNTYWWDPFVEARGGDD